VEALNPAVPLLDAPRSRLFPLTTIAAALIADEPA
jgi:hypothetical protein